tara:strand:+ start:4879 stop:5622 length:744 start_codon:yes stop_codon:yes gene_type:complete
MLKDKVILITGTTSGIGKILLNYFKDNNFIISINREKSQELYLNEENILNYNIDITNFDSVKNCIKDLIHKSKKPDIFILNAGINIYDNEDYFNIIKFKECFDVNFFGSMNFVSAISELKISKKKIVFISSTSNIIPNPAAIGYFSSKLLLKKTSKLLNLNNDNIYKVSILGPIKTNISRNIKSPKGIAQIIYNLLVAKPENMVKKFEKFLLSKKKYFYFTKLSIIVYWLIATILIFIPGLYKGGKK